MGVVVESRAKEFRPGNAVLAIPNGNEGFVEMFVAKANRAAILPQWHEHLVMAQPLGCVLKAARRLEPVAGKAVAIVGQGGMGLLWTQFMHTQGARRIIVSDLNDRRLDVARQVHATDTINASREDTLARVRELTGGEMADVVVEAVGLSKTQRLCLDLAKPGGEVHFFGVPHYEAEFAFPFTTFFRKSLTLTASASTDAPRDFPVAFDLILSGKIDTAAMLTHRLPFTALNEAMALASDQANTEAVRILLTVEDRTHPETDVDGTTNREHRT
jgi:threonine dehydrogenase-like Zn-dependent dehydrogenase